MASRGEVGVLIVNLDSLLRISSNPFFSYLLERVDEEIARPGPKAMLQVSRARLSLSALCPSAPAEQRQPAVWRGGNE